MNWIIFLLGWLVVAFFVACLVGYFLYKMEL